MVRTSSDGMKYMADLRGGRFDEKMDHLVSCVVALGCGEGRMVCVCVRACVCAYVMHMQSIDSAHINLLTVT